MILYYFRILLIRTTIDTKKQMEFNTINKIREKRDSIRETIKKLNLKGYSSKTYGSENEYTFRGLIGEIEALLTDISTLTRHPSKFIKISTYSERNNIYSYLNQIETYLKSPESYISSFESLKTILRGYNIRYFSDRQIEFESEIEEVRKIKLELQQVLVESEKINKSIKSNDEDIEEKLEKSNNKLKEIETELENITYEKNKLLEQTEALKKTNSSLETINETASENLVEITELLTESKSNEKLIT